jgi:hypothetical protein
MKRSRRPHFWRWIGPHAWTPQAIVHVAQAAVLLIGAVMIDGYLTRSMNDADACRGALALGVALLLAAPRRSSELLGAVAIWLTTAEFLVASRTGMFALWRWSETLASLAIILVLARLSYFRAGSCQSLALIRGPRPASGSTLASRHFRCDRRSRQIGQGLGSGQGLGASRR